MVIVELPARSVRGEDIDVVEEKGELRGG